MTPNVPNSGRTTAHATMKGGTAYHNGKKVQIGLESQVSQWRTPLAGDSERGPKSTRGSTSAYKDPAGRHSLVTEVANWPTPRSRDWKGSGQTDERADGRSRMDQLDWATERGFYSPPVRLTPAGQASSTARRSTLRLYRMLMSPKSPDFARLRGWAKRALKRKLNPFFVEWLMGWPTGWTDCERAVTGLSLWRRRSRGYLLTLSSVDTPEQPTLL